MKNLIIVLALVTSAFAGVAKPKADITPKEPSYALSCCWSEGFTSCVCTEGSNPNCVTHTTCTQNQTPPIHFVDNIEVQLDKFMREWKAEHRKTPKIEVVKVTHVTWTPNDAKADGLAPFKQTATTQCPNLPDGTHQTWCCNSTGTDCKCQSSCGSWPW